MSPIDLDPPRWTSVSSAASAAEMLAGPLVMPERALRFAPDPARAAARIGELAIVLVGAGAVGSQAARLLAALAPRRLWIVDEDVFEAENRVSTPFVPALREWKALSAGHAAKALSPATEVDVGCASIQAFTPAAFWEADLFLVAVDNASAERATGELGAALGITVIAGSIQPEFLLAQVRTVRNVTDGRGPCLACTLLPNEWDELEHATVFSCTGGARGRTGAGPVVSSATIACLPALAASLLVQEAVLAALEISDRPRDAIVEYCGVNHASTTSALVRSPSCRNAHEPWTRVRVPRPMADRTPREILASTRASAGTSAELEPAPSSLELDGWFWSALSACACAEHERCERFVRVATTGERCPRCDEARVAHPLHARHQVSGELLERILDCPLTTLGVSHVEAAVVRADEHTWLVTEEGRTQ